MPSPLDDIRLSVPPRALGRRPHDPKRPVLRLSRYLTGSAPQHAATADYTSRIRDFGMYENDQFCVCGPTALANQRKQVSVYLHGIEDSPSQDDVFDLYRRSGNPTFNPRTAQGDNGVVLADMLSAALSGGIGHAKPLAYAAVDVTDLDQVHAAISLFGSVIAGVTLDVAQQQQTDAHQAWDYRRGSKEWGGHAVLIAGYTGKTGRGMADLQVVSWAEVIGCTDGFATHQLDEAYVVIWPEMLGSAEFQAGLNIAELAADYQQLTGRPFPAGPAPAPTPVPVTPPGSDAAAFRAALAAFLPQAEAFLASEHPTQQIEQAEGARFRG